jgi:hypothetical protein
MFLVFICYLTKDVQFSQDFLSDAKAKLNSSLSDKISSLEPKPHMTNQRSAFDEVFE